MFGTTYIPILLGAGTIGLYCITFSLLWLHTCTILLLPISFCNSWVHENILQPWDFYSNIFTSLFLLFIIKSPYIFWVRRELTSEFLKEGKNSCDASQWTADGESLQLFMSVIFSQVSLTRHIFLFFPYISMWRSHTWLSLSLIWYVLAGFL